MPKTKFQDVVFGVMMAFLIVDPSKNPRMVPYSISVCTCLVMCPTMSLIATCIFNEPSLMNWLKAFTMNLPMALLYQLLICGPVVRFLFRHIFPNKKKHKADKTRLTKDPSQCH